LTAENPTSRIQNFAAGTDRPLPEIYSPIGRAMFHEWGFHLSIYPWFWERQSM